MATLFFDIETLRADESLKPIVLEALGEPKKLPKGTSLEEWQEEGFVETSLDGNFGRILCLAYIKEPPMSDKAEILTGDERKILTDFWQLVKDVDLFVGHNVLSFDLKFIWKRSVVHNIKPSKDISFRKYQSSPVFDTMQEWEKWDTRSSGSAKLDTLAKIFGFPSSKEKMHGSEVQAYYEAGRLKEIYDYCKADVELTRKVYFKMTFGS